VMAARACPEGAPPVVHHEDGFNADEAERLNRSRNWYRRFALGAAHAVVVPSARLERIARDVWHQPAARVRRISNGVDVGRYARAPRADAIPGFRRRGKEVVIGSLAGLRTVKDLPLLVRAVGGVVLPVRLVIVGEGPERESIVDAVDAMGLERSVHLPGFLPEPHRYIGLFDIFALSSQSEQQPIAVMEAMAAGLPVVAPPVGDVFDMVAEENRPYLSADRHEVSLRDRLQALAADAELRGRLGAANQVRARALFDERHMIASYATLYEEAMRRPGALG
jgi:glycosyltransferase involved in cell wall biosynthesis